VKQSLTLRIHASFAWSDPIALWFEVLLNNPVRTGSRPVWNAARDGVQIGAAL
jgi:hypothetical protein